MDIQTRLKALKSRMKIEPETLSVSLEGFIRKYMKELEREGVILGLSGGLDSAVVAALCKKAVGPEKTSALILPEKDTKKQHVQDALDFAKELGIKAKLLDITSYLKQIGIYKLFPLDKFAFPAKSKDTLVRKAYDFYKKKTGETPFSASLLGFENKEFGSYLGKSNAYYRAKHRMRMLLLYLYAESENRLVVGAANRSEARIGFFVKHGCDDAADIMPLLNLYKTQVRQLARYLDIPSNIIEKSPSPDIIPGITDKSAIGIPYEKLDLILLALEENWENHEIAEALELEEKKVVWVKDTTRKSAHMRTVYKP
ncbi:NAD(+) synthetase [candidate division WOR-3 bacterium JGI_Cruoil_03_51_56]|uniref:NH(3)-dependent NAD(+) synthetase n=1 Tax=candidate division WOR-3 bacterium JGI_Cruoil_03_51_56 TaxID=1973747 RepID=A0A235BUC2_UNCW3|nr:MAG: NAD(+) synthetase [candidate division WOR-3 bacterium JGI_Cruoil_03_51_56]